MAQHRRDPRIRPALSLAMRALVQKHGSQQDVAKRLGLSQRGVSQIINQQATPRVETLVAMREHLGWSIDAILGLESAQPDAVKIGIIVREVLVREGVQLHGGDADGDGPRVDHAAELARAHAVARPQLPPASSDGRAGRRRKRAAR